MASGPIQELSGDVIMSAIRRAQGPISRPPPGVPPRPPRDPDRPAPVEEPPSPVPIPRPDPPPVRSVTRPAVPRFRHNSRAAGSPLHQTESPLI
jgi:hypothetical protein